MEAHAPYAYSSSFSVTAKAKWGSVREIEAHMRAFPGFVLTSTGSSLSFCIHARGPCGAQHVSVTMGRSEISCLFGIESPVIGAARTCLLEFLSVLAYAAKFYDVDTGSLCAAVAGALPCERLPGAEPAALPAMPDARDERISSLASSNARLSSMLVSSMVSASMAERRIALLASFCSAAMRAFPVGSLARPNGNQGPMITREELAEVEAALQGASSNTTAPHGRASASD